MKFCYFLEWKHAWSTYTSLPVQDKEINLVYRNNILEPIVTALNAKCMKALYQWMVILVPMELRWTISSFRDMACLECCGLYIPWNELY